MADKAAKRTEQAVKRAVRQAEKMAATWTPPSTQTRRQKSREASTEEQLKILGMLEQGIISVEEAETLLKALEE
jgi:K+-sensing histidine kinase KdpD